MDRECCKRERYGYALYNRFKVPKLYKLALDGDWDLIPARCKAHPKEAQFVNAYAPSDTALHRILRTPTGLLDVDATTRQHIEHFKLEAVSALLAAHRPAASTRDAFGRTPLHLACMDIASCGEPAAFMLVDQCPQAAMIQDVEGRTPMHYLVGRNDSIPCSLLSKLITASPKALQTQDIVSETPLEIVKNRGKEIENVEEVTATLQSIEFSLPPSKARAESVSSEAFQGAEKPSQAAIRSTTI